MHASLREDDDAFDIYLATRRKLLLVNRIAIFCAICDNHFALQKYLLNHSLGNIQQ